MMHSELSKSELIDIIEKLNNELTFYKNESELKDQEISYLKRKLYGRSKESHSISEGQMSLFDEPFEIKEEAELPEEVQTTTRKKSKGKKRKILAKFPEEEVVHELENDCCASCKQQMKKIGKSKVREELIYIPAVLKRKVHYTTSYKCEHCSQENNDVIVKAFVSKAPIQNSLGSASIITETIHKKYGLKVPAYRQEKDWKRLGLDFTRQQITDWHIKCSDYYFSYIYELLQKELKNQDVIHADETSYRVIESSKTNNYYWLFQSGKYEDKQVVLYHYDETRKHEVPEEFLDGYTGYLHSDMYGAYLNMENVINVGCLAHLRRKFFEAMPDKNDSTSVASKFVRLCDKIFRLEKAWKNLSPKERQMKRTEELAPLLKELFNRATYYENQVGIGKLGQAINYTIKYKPYFMNVLKDGRLEISNNRAERSIKELVIGRKNWLFSTSKKGATSSGIILSLIRTAELNGLDSKKYIQLLLEELPTLYSLSEMEQCEAYLPWGKIAQERCRVN